MSPTVPPPSPQEIHRKLSVHSVTRRAKVDSAISGTESDSDSLMLPGSLGPVGSLHVGPSSLQQPLSSIAERRFGSGEDSDEEEEEEEGGWRSADLRANLRLSVDEGVVKSGYLWKKGERRKTWKKRWFVLRTAHLAYYKTSAEYELLRLLELSDVHSCTPVTLKRHDNTFGLISPVRTYYLQASTSDEVQQWVQAIEEARQSLRITSPQMFSTSPIPIPTSPRHAHPPVTYSPTARAPLHNLTSSDSEDASPGAQAISFTSPPNPSMMNSPKKPLASSDSSKVVLAGYLMKCDSKRRNWRKRWFTLTGEKLVYSGSHMDTKPHRTFSFSQILDALEYDLPSGRHNPQPPAPPPSTPSVSPGSDADASYATHTFKIVTTKRTLLLCAPSEEDEIKWLGAVRALIARRSSGTGSGESTSYGIVASRSGEVIFSVSPPRGLGSKARRSSLNASSPATEISQGTH